MNVNEGVVFNMNDQKWNMNEHQFLSMIGYESKEI